MTRRKPITIIGCNIRIAKERTIEGGKIYACLRCRGIGFFDIQGTYPANEYWITAKTARLTHERDPRIIRDSQFLHHCTRDTKHPINKRVKQKRPNR